jgi:hypothetical protein
MKIVINEKMIRRNARIGQIATLGGLAILAGGMIISFRKQELFLIAWASLILGFILSQIGIYFGNRWGRSPRPDEKLNQALKGLDERYTIYHYTTPISHLLIGPAGIWVLLTRHQRGRVTYEKGRYQLKGGGIFQTYLRIFAQEGIGRPDLEIPADVQTVQTFLKKGLPDDELPPIQVALVFLNDNAELDINNAPYLTVGARKLKEYIRKSAKGKALSPEKVKEVEIAIDNIK